MIERSFIGGDPLSAEDAGRRLRNAPAWVVQRVNGARESRGLAPVVVRRGVATPVRRPARRAPAPVAPRPSRSIPTAPPAALPKIGIVLVGVAAGEPGPDRVEIFADTAFDKWLARAQRDPRGVEFVIRTRGHDSPAVVDSAAGSIAFRTVGVVGVVAVWTPDPANPAHRAAVESIAAGVDQCSIEVRVLRARLIDGVRMIDECEPAGVAVLRVGEKPVYRGAVAGTLRRGEDESAALVRLAGRSLRRGWTA
jgi:hypothetical protein